MSSPAPLPSPAAADPIHILLVDDRPENLLALEAVLAPLGVNLLTAGSGEAALQIARDHDCAAFLLDVQMPGMDGYETARRLRDVDPGVQVPIIFITATQVETSQITRGYALGAVDYVLKPFTPEVLRQKVAAYVTLFEHTRQLTRRLNSGAHLEAQVNVLVVNDDLTGLLATEMSLDSLGGYVRVITASSGQQALRLLLKHHFALILLDVHMPDMDGFEVAAIMRENQRFRHIPLIFVTATTRAEADVTRGYACGAIDFIFTPIAPELLRAKVRSLIDQFRQQRVLTHQLSEIEQLNQRLTATSRELSATNAELERRVAERTAELSATNESLRAEISARQKAEAQMEQQLDELRRWQTATVGREGRVLEIKGEVNALLARLGEPARYASEPAANETGTADPAQLGPDSPPP